MPLTMNKVLVTSFLGLSLTMGQALATNEANENKKPAVQEESQEQDTTITDTVVAIVNGTDITRTMLDTALDVATRSTSGDEADESTILEELVTLELARQEAKTSGLAERDDIKEKITEFTDKLILHAWTKEKASSFEISDAELQAAYEKRIAETSKFEYHARHILLKDEEAAKAIIKELNDTGTDFAELAKKKSTGPSGSMGGDLGWFRADAMVLPFSEAVDKMEVGSISKAPIKTQFGWHVIKLEEKRDVKLPDFEKLKPQLKRLLEQEKMDAFMKSLREKANIQVLLKQKEVKAADSEEPTEQPEEAAQTEAVQQASEKAQAQDEASEEASSTQENKKAE